MKRTAAGVAPGQAGSLQQQSSFDVVHPALVTPPSPSKPHPSFPTYSFYHRLSTNPYVVYPFALLLFLLFQLTLSYLFTRTLHFGLLPSTPTPLTLTPSELSLHDGIQSPTIYLAILGDVFDVTAGRKYYGPDGGYHAFAGKDGTRAFITGCFESGAVADVRGLGEKEIRALNKWREFYVDHKQYRYVGKVLNPVVAEDAPLPNDDCK